MVKKPPKYFTIIFSNEKIRYLHLDARMDLKLTKPSVTN